MPFRLNRSFNTTRITIWTVFAAAFITLLALAGWILDFNELRSVKGDWASMKMNTAIGILLSAIALLLHLSNKKWMAIFLGSCIFLIGLVTNLQYWLGWNAGIDQFLIPDPNISATYPGRMSPVTALIFMLLGAALIFYPRKSITRSGIVTFFAAVVLILSFIAFTGYIFNADRLYKLAEYASISLNTSVAFILLSIAILFSKPDSGFVAAFNTDSRASRIGGRQLLFIIFLLIVIGWFRLRGEEIGLYDTQFGVSIMIISFAIIFTFLTWFSVKRLNIAEEKIRRNEESYRSLFEQATDAIFISDQMGRLLEVNASACEMLGYTGDQLCKKNIDELYTREELFERPLMYNELMKGEKTRVERSIRRSDGSLLFVDVTGKMLSDGRIMAVIRDLSYRKEAEEEIKKTERRFQSMVENNDSIIALLNGQFEIMYRSPSADRITGRTLEMTKQDGYLQLVHPEDRETLTRTMRSLLKDPGKLISISVRSKHPSGNYINLEGTMINLLHDENVKAIVTNFRDVTDRKKAEAEMLKANERFNLIAKATNDFVWDAYMENDKVWWNDNYYAQLGWDKTKEQAGTDSWQKHIHPEDRERVTGRINHILMNTKETTWNDEYRFGKVDGSFITVYDRSYIMRDEQGNPIRMIGAMTDITMIKQAEEDLRKSEQKYKLLFENNPMPLWMFAIDDLRFIDINSAAIKHYGYSKEEFLKMTIKDIRPAEDVERVKERAAKKRDGIMYSGTWKHIKKDRSLIDVDIIAHDIVYDGKMVRLVLANDVTERLKAEELLRKSYEDIRRLAAHLEDVREEERLGIAREIHDELGQQLTVLKMDISWLNKNITQDEDRIRQKMKDLLSVIDSTIKTVRRISSELRPSVLDDLGLVAALEWMSKEFEKRSGIKTTLVTDIDDMKILPKPATDLFRIFQESLTNIARHAEASLVEASLSINGDTMLLKVTDNGKGFNIATLENKKTLGILGMKERVSIIGGKYSILSYPGDGTTIEVKVPVSSIT